MDIMYPGGPFGGMVPYPYGDDDEDEEEEDDDYGWNPMGGYNGYGGRGYGDFYRGGYNMHAHGPYPMVGHHNIYQWWPPYPQKEEKKKKDEKKGPSNKKAFFLVRQKPSKSKSGGKGGEWKGYCNHMPAKTHVAKASNPFWYLFT